MTEKKKPTNTSTTMTWPAKGPTYKRTKFRLTPGQIEMIDRARRRMAQPD